MVNKVFHLNSFPFSNLKMIGVLLYHEYPTTIIYEDSDKSSFILEWVDCDEDGDNDLFLIFQTNKNSIQRFLSGTISHREFIMSPLNKYLMEFAGSLEFPLNIKLISPDRINNDFLPDEDVYFDLDKGVDIDIVLNHFNINLQKIKKEDTQYIESIQLTTKKEVVKPLNVLSQKEILMNIANYENTEVINIHIKDGDKVKLGTAETKALGEVLISFDKLYREIALDFYEGTGRGNIISFNNRQTLLEKISTEVFLNMAASYSIYVRPLIKTQQFNINSKTESENISERIFSLFRSSEKKEILYEVFNQYSSYVFKSYIDFLEKIKENDIEVDYNFFSPYNGQSYDEEFDSKKAWDLIENIHQLSVQADSDFSLRVKFTALNCNTGHYTLEDLKGVSLNGHFDKLIKESMRSLNFYDLYEVKIHRKEIKETGRIEPKIEDTLISCLLV